MDLGVRGVLELLRHVALALADDLAGEVDRLAHAAQRGRLEDLGAVGAQQLVRSRLMLSGIVRMSS